MNWIKKLLTKEKIIEHTIEHTKIEKVIVYKTDPNNEWFEFDKIKPPHEVVLVACDTFDCGWTMNTAWWNEKDQVWMVTGSVKTTEAHLPYTHWRKLPPYPDNK